ncbi:MAG: cysteine--tRNA ligase [Oscillospiraceae bacterium]|jgi:cysteinyl-tRNA synthetase|nr:cysteine--tRNA ligase [Oscillospiraceae bacterium]
MKLYNVLTRSKEEFVPVGDEVKIYACGPTVYDFIHIGNARPLCLFDVLRRYLKYLGYKVKFVQNFTDIDDKIIKKAQKENVTCLEVAERFIKEYKEDAAGLNIWPADVHPKATETIGEIIEMIKTLISKNHAYTVPSGDIYFDIKSFSDYGKLSNQSLEELIAGERVEVSQEKRNGLDFVLWKMSKENEPSWESPWGLGRPGWHIECSAMAKKHLGKTIDIHCGGQDLIFPHHENEIAQSECANGAEFARFWLHNGFVNINSQKMSKSLENFSTVREIANAYGYETIRYLMVTAHYRSPLEFNEKMIFQYKSAITRLGNFRRNIIFLKENRTSPSGVEVYPDLPLKKQKFFEFMDDDLNTSGAMSELFNIVRGVNEKVATYSEFSEESVVNLIDSFDELTSILGICNARKISELTDEIRELISERETARKEKKWERSDEIRKILKGRGILIEDTLSGVKVNILQKEN